MTLKLVYWPDQAGGLIHSQAVNILAVDQNLKLVVGPGINTIAHLEIRVQSGYVVGEDVVGLILRHSLTRSGGRGLIARSRPEVSASGRTPIACQGLVHSTHVGKGKDRTDNDH